MMKVERRVGGSEARFVLTRMVLDEAVLGPVSALWPKPPAGLFGSKAENLVGLWAVQHYRRHRAAPGRAIGIYYERWAEAQKDEGVTEFVAAFLEAVSDEAAKGGPAVHPSVALDTASRVFRRVALDRVREGIAAGIEVGDLDAAVKAWQSYRPPEVGTDDTIDVFAGGSFACQALTDVDKVLVRWNQEALADFFDRAFSAEEFVAFIGRSKVGKSFWLQEVAFQAIAQNRNVAFFETGDQSRDQITRRIIARAAGRPVRPDPRVRVPVRMEPAETPGELPLVAYQDYTYHQPIPPEDGDRILREFTGVDADDRLKLVVRPNSSISIAGVAAKIEDWERDGWHPDLIVIDYADILAPLDGKADTRDQINATWKMMRQLNQEKHCCLVTATQSNREGYEAESLDVGMTSEDKRKNDHCTCMVAINQDAKEEAAGLYRLGWFYGRDMDINKDRQVYTARCLAVANPAVLSTFG